MTSVAPSERRMHVIQGEFAVSDDPMVVLDTILGSCVAACLRDPIAGVGGMNHFLLSGEGRAGDSDSTRFGVNAMELLINGLLQRGAIRRRMEAKLFGGARVVAGLSDIGEQNAEFAERFLRQEGVTLRGGSLRGDRARRIQFWPVSGRARQIELDRSDDTVFRTERRPRPVAPVAPAAAAPSDGDLELF